MRTYNIKIVSQTIAIFLFIIILTLFMSGIFLIVQHDLNRNSTVLVIILFVATSYSLWQKFATARTGWTLDNNGIHLTWVKQFAFNRNNNIYLKWAEIEKVDMGLDRGYYHFKIKLITGQKLKFYHDRSTTGDDFEDFIKDLDQFYKDKKTFLSI